MRIVKRLAIIIFVLIACVGCDQSNRHLAELRLPKIQALLFLLGTVSLQVAHNKGGLLSFGESIPKVWDLAFVRYGASAMLVALLAYTLFFSAVRIPYILALSLIFTGGTSNLIDRFVYEGYVVDFINSVPGLLRTGILNAADIAIAIGVLMLLVTRWRVQKMEAKS